MSNEQLFANGRIAVLSNKLLTADKYIRLTECGNLAEALRTLGECGYSAAAAESDYEQALRAELDELLAEIKELCANVNALKYLLCKYDYHNAKVLVKGKYMRRDFTAYCFENASYQPAAMRDLINNDDYGKFSRNMAEACDSIDARFADGDRSPQTVDRLLDKAYFADLARYAKASLSRLMSKLSEQYVDYTDLTLVMRMHKLGIDAAEADKWLIDGGSIGRKTLLGLWSGELSVSDLPEEWRGICSGVDSERRYASMRNRLIEEYADPLTLQPALKYFYAKTDETELVRRILADIKNGTDKEKIKERLNAK